MKWAGKKTLIGLVYMNSRTLSTFNDAIQPKLISGFCFEAGR